MYSFLLKKYLTTPHKKALELLIGVIVLSVIPYFVNVPEFFLSRKENVLNKYFVKLSWGWTLVLLTVYTSMMVLSYEYWKRRFFDIIARLSFMTAVWFCWTVVVFGTVRNLTTRCYDSGGVPISNATDQEQCKEVAGKLIGYDISGHAFILTLTTLMIFSELQVQKTWKQETSGSLKVPIKSLFCLCCVLSLMWQLSLALTCLYYHTFGSKLIGASTAILSWFVAYSIVIPKIFTTPDGNVSTRNSANEEKND